MAEPNDARTPAYWGDCIIDLVIGLFILLYDPRWLTWASFVLFHTSFDFQALAEDGSAEPYSKSIFFWMDLGPALFGVLLIVASLLMCVRRRWAIGVAFGLTAISTVYNAGYVAASYRTYGFPLISAGAAIFGGFMLTRQWQMLTRKPQFS